MKRKLVLENGQVFNGVGFGSNNEVVKEIIFNTSVVGYQEILSDPVSFDKIICMSYPIIGSYGLTDEDYESKSLTISGLICKEYNDEPSNFRYTHKLGEVMDDEGIPGIMGIDTRELIRVIRDNGTMKALICDLERPIEECMAIINAYKDNLRPSIQISSKKVWHSRTANPLYTVVCVDCGIKRSIIRSFNNMASNVVVVPQTISAEEIMKYKPTGLFISDGPGDAKHLNEAIELIKSLRGRLPIFGMGLGADLIALAYGADTYKEKVGHNGCNLPVRNINTGRIEITAQGSLYGINRDSLAKAQLDITHENVLDNTVMGFKNDKDSTIAIKYNPGSNLMDSDNAYNRFAVIMKSFGGKANAKKNRY